MKIFSWVHRRFRPKTTPDEDAADNDSATLLENKIAFATACDGWKEGILAIGTLGSTDLFNDFYMKEVDEETFVNNQVLFFGSEDDEDDQEGEMERPLVLKASKHGFDHVQKQDPSPCAKPNSGIQDVGVTKLDSMELDIQGTKTKIRKSGERITLADLLWGDSEKNLLKNKLTDDHFKNPIADGTTDTKFIKSFFISKKKKKLDKDDSSSHPFQKTKRLMRKMLKKKIHPDTGIQKKESAEISRRQEIDVHAT